MKNNLDELQFVSIAELLDFFKGPKAIRDSKPAVDAVRLAVSALSAVGRIKATERARDATQLVVLKSLAEDKKQFEKYVAASMPHLNPAKQIAEK